MIKGKIEKGNVQVSVCGTTTILAAEVCCLIRAIHKTMADEDKESAEKFKKIIVDEVNGDMIFSDNLDGDEKLSVDVDDDNLDKLKKLLEGLEKLKGMLEDED